MPKVVVRTPAGDSRTFALEERPLVLGRSSEAGASFPDDFSLSRLHLQLERDNDDGWVVSDIGSKNGTWLNGERVTTRRRLAPGDRIEAGHLVVTFEPEQSRDEVVFFADAPAAPQRTMVARLEGVLGSVASLADVPTRGSGGRAAAPGQIPLASTAVKALVQAGRELSGRRPLHELFPLILNLSLEAVGAERGAVLILEAGTLVPRAVKGEGLQISTTVRDKVLTEKASILVADVFENEAFRNQQSIAGQQVRSMLAVPLQAEDRVIGLVYVDSSSFVRSFDANDLNLLTVLGNVAAIRIEHERLAEVEQSERLMERDLEQAAIIQRGLLPEAPPDVPRVGLGGHNASCRTVGGDYYDFLPYADGRVGLVLGDVSGKGIPAAILMASLQARVHLLAEEPGDLSKLMGRLNRILASHCPPNRFVSLFFCILDPGTGSVLYCNAGHNPPLLLRRSGEIERLTGSGPVLGVLPDVAFTQRTASMDPGDLLLLFSDGVTEAVDPDQEEFGEERLIDELRRCGDADAREVVDCILGALERWSAGAPPADDVTLLAARRLPL
jgi:sigma-B regulation protein RsbU (phosphoserine phosphatase)